MLLVIMLSQRMLCAQTLLNIMADFSSSSVSAVSFTSFNMHGYNQGKTTLDSLCSESEFNTDIIFLQEHWLTPANRDKIRYFSDRYTAFGISAMESVVGYNILRGRPYGGVCTLVKSNKFKMNFNKCSERYTVVVVDNLLLINVYFPTISSDSDLCIVQSMLTDLEEFICMFPNCSVVMSGDFNTNIGLHSCGNAVYINFLDKFNVVPCNSLIHDGLGYTYCHESLQHYSYIDFICVSRSIANNLIEFKVLELPLNMSDHLPIFARFEYSFQQHTKHNTEISPKPRQTHSSLRWDHAQLPLYYNYTRELLQPLLDRLNSVFIEWMAVDLCSVTGISYEGHTEYSNLYASRAARSFVCDNIESMFACLSESLNCAAKSVIPV